MDSRLPALGWEWGLGYGGTEQKGKSVHGHGQQCGDCCGEVIKGDNGNGNNTLKYIKNKKLKTKRRRKKISGRNRKE